MTRTIYLLLLGCLLVPSSHAEKAVAGAPQIKCEISMQAWCIATFYGSINMKDDGNVRIWTLQVQGSPIGSSMSIIESKACSDNAKEKINFVDSRKISVNGELPRQEATYELNSNGCRLIFQWPEGDAGIVYKQAMLYGVLVGESKRIQLYKVSGK